MPIDPNHEPLKRAVYLSDRDWNRILNALVRVREKEELIKNIHEQLHGRSS